MGQFQFCFLRNEWHLVNLHLVTLVLVVEAHYVALRLLRLLTALKMFALSLRLRPNLEMH